MKVRIDGVLAPKADVCLGLCEEARDGPQLCPLIREHRLISEVQSLLLHFGPAGVLFAAGASNGDYAAGLIGAGASLATSPILTRLIRRQDNEDAAEWPATTASALLTAGLMLLLGASPLMVIPAAVITACWPDLFHRLRGRFVTPAERCASASGGRLGACACRFSNIAGGRHDCA